MRLQKSGMGFADRGKCCGRRTGEHGDAGRVWRTAADPPVEVASLEGRAMTRSADRRRPGWFSLFGRNGRRVAAPWTGNHRTGFSACDPKHLVAGRAFE